MDIILIDEIEAICLAFKVQLCLIMKPQCENNTNAPGVDLNTIKINYMCRTAQNH